MDRVIPVVVIKNLQDTEPTLKALRDGGINTAEITFRTAAAESVIREVSKRFPEMYVGAGTVLNITDLHRAFDSGAKFAVAPGFNPKVVAEAVKCNLDFFPAVCTPSEVEQAMEFGCRMLKFFPAEACGGIPMLKSIIAPYKHLGVKFMPTGGVKPVNVESYLQIPEVAAVGGTWLNKCDDETIRQAVAIAAKYIKK